MCDRCRAGRSCGHPPRDPPHSRRVSSRCTRRSGASGSSGHAGLPCSATQRATRAGRNGAMKSSLNSARQPGGMRRFCSQRRSRPAGGRGGSVTWRCRRTGRDGSAAASAAGAAPATGGGGSAASLRVSGWPSGDASGAASAGAASSGGAPSAAAASSSVTSSTTASPPSGAADADAGTGAAGSAAGGGSAGGSCGSGCTCAPRTAKGRLTTPTLCTSAAVMRVASGCRLCQATTRATRSS